MILLVGPQLISGKVSELDTLSTLAGAGTATVVVAIVTAVINAYTSRKNSLQTHELEEEKQALEARLKSFEMLEKTVTRLESEITDLRSQVTVLREQVAETQKEKRLLAEKYSALWGYTRNLQAMVSGNDMPVLPKMLEADYLQKE